MNRHFVSVKVDREERRTSTPSTWRPYRRYGRGGWPMSVFATPEGSRSCRTYFPTVPPWDASFRQVLEASSMLGLAPSRRRSQRSPHWRVASRLRPPERRPPRPAPKSADELCGEAAKVSVRCSTLVTADSLRPKSPNPAVGSALATSPPQHPVRVPRRRPAHPRAMASGGIYDHLGAGSPATRSTHTGPATLREDAVRPALIARVYLHACNWT